METVRQLYRRSWRGLVLAVSLALMAYLLYFRGLASLLPGYSTPELNAYGTASNWHAVVTDPINGPYKVLVWLLGIMVHHGPLVTRLVAASYGTVAGLLFFIILRAWYGYRTALLASILFATSGALLHVARLGTGDILQLGVLALLNMGLWYRQQRNQRVFIAYAMVATLVLLWYVPGMIWFEALGVLSVRSVIRNQLRRLRTLYLAGLSIVLLALVTPLAMACARKPTTLLQVAGLPRHLDILAHFGGNLWHAILAIAVRSNGSALVWVGHAPLLDAIEVILGLLGAYYVYREASVRRLFLFGSIAVGLILVAMGGGVTFACLLPGLYLLIACGLDSLLSQWLAVFPRNPIARLTGVGAVCLMLSFSVLYQTRAYFIAWSHAPATRQTFDHTKQQPATIQ